MIFQHNKCQCCLSNLNFGTFMYNAINDKASDIQCFNCTRTENKTCTQQISAQRKVHCTTLVYQKTRRCTNKNPTLSLKKLKKKTSQKKGVPWERVQRVKCFSAHSQLRLNSQYQIWPYKFQGSHPGAQNQE